MKSCSQLGLLPLTAIVVDLTFCSFSVTYVWNLSMTSVTNEHTHTHTHTHRHYRLNIDSGGAKGLELGRGSEWTGLDFLDWNGLLEVAKGWRCGSPSVPLRHLKGLPPQ